MRRGPYHDHIPRRYAPQIVKPLIYHIQVGKKVSDGNYGGDEISVLLQVNVPAGTDPASDQAQAVIAATIGAARRQVYDYLNIDETLSVGQVKTAVVDLVGGEVDEAASLYTDAIDDGVIPAGRLTPEQMSALEDWANGGADRTGVY